jgi:TonB family protein
MRLIRSPLHHKPFAAALFAIAIASITPAVPQSAKTIRVSELVLRRSATKKVTPEFPETARRQKKTGVAVAQLEVNEAGMVTTVDVLEAPDPTIKAAVSDAVRQWEFKPTTLAGEAVRVRGKLTFYYVIDSQGSRVDDPR